MSLIRPSNAVANASARAVNVAITGGLDLRLVKAEYQIFFGSRHGTKGRGYVIASATPNVDYTGGTITLTEALEATQTNQPFVIDTMAYTGDATFLTTSYLGQIVTGMLQLFGDPTLFGTASKRLPLDKSTSGGISEILWRIGGVNQFRLGQQQTDGLEYLSADYSTDGSAWATGWRLRRDGNVNLPSGRKLAIGHDLPIGVLDARGGRSYFGSGSDTFAIGLGFSAARIAAGDMAWIGASDSATPSIVISNKGGTEIARFTNGLGVGIGGDPAANRFAVIGGRVLFQANSEPYGFLVKYAAASDGVYIGNTADGAGLQVSNAGGSALMTVRNTGVTFMGPPIVPSYAKATVPAQNTVSPGAIIYVTDEVGGATLAFANGTTWKRVSDLANIS